MTPLRKRNGRLACGCRPYHEVEDPEQVHLCRIGRPLYNQMVAHDLGTPEGDAIHKAYIEHIGLQSDRPEEMAV
jgi:hypothetical protein